MAAIKQLYDLQTVDLQLDRDNARLAEIRKALGDEAPLARYRALAARYKTALQKATAKQADLDNAIGGIEEKMKAAEARLYGGTVKASRELQDLQADLDMLKRQRSEQETTLLQVLEEVDEAKNGYQKASRMLSLQEKSWKAEQASMTEEQSKLEAEVADLRAKRESQVKGISPADLSLYDQTRKAHKGQAVAMMRNNMCEACRVGIPTRQATDVRAGNVVRCPNCGLILLPE